MTARKPHRGFTIVELMITVAVLGILAAFAVPSMTDFYDRKRLVSQTEAVSNLIQLGRSEAIKHPSAVSTQAVSATFKPTTPWFVGLSNGTSACTNATTCVLSEGGVSITRYLPATDCTGCTMSIHEDSPTGTSVTSSVVMVFDLRGTVTSATTHDYFITLNSPKGKQLSLSVSKIGRISICSPGSTVSGYPSCS